MSENNNQPGYLSGSGKNRKAGSAEKAGKLPKENKGKKAIKAAHWTEKCHKRNDERLIHAALNKT
ncbi:MAG: hypothetical protein NC112_06895 [Oxalobacter formigenes]|nr:hypothetical protein [Oxalobacter formigenes]